MSKKYEKGIFLFHRDLRIADNKGLIEASSQCNKIYTCFIFTPEQVGNTNQYRSNDAIQFMVQSLEDLTEEIKKSEGELSLFYGKQTTIIKQYIENHNIECVFFNKDYTPYAVKRDNETAEFCKKQKIECQMSSDYYMYEPGTITTGSKTVYKKFTPYYDEVLHKPVDTPKRKTINNISKNSKKMENLITIDKAFERFIKPNTKVLVHGGRIHGIAQLKKSLKEQSHYADTRDYFAKTTSLLSAYLKFGCISIREVYHAYKEEYGLNSEFIRQLIWREFYAGLLYAYPLTQDTSYTYRGIKWRTSNSDFEKWCKGETGYPLVDACMRQLNTTGYMHNRGRMVVANFLVKTLLINWELGAKYFATKLVDYDIANNALNWQNIASTGPYNTPYFRDMSAWIQSKKFDKDAEFIKKWVPELKDVLARDIHKWYESYKDEKYKDIKYGEPIVDYAEQKEKMLEMYKSI